MNIEAIYTKYHIFPALKEHQLRVTAVAQQICELQKEQVDIQGVTIACLLHDMGNVLKLDFTQFPSFFEPEGVDFWKSVRADFARKYGEDEHNATVRIVEEVMGSALYTRYINAFGHTHASHLAVHGTTEEKICTYADMRVTPFGITSMRERFNEMRERYKNHPTKKIGTEAELDIQLAAYEDIERQLFINAPLGPSGITEQSSIGYVNALRSFEIHYV